MKRFGLWVLALLACGAAAVLTLAPHLPALLREGFPPSVWAGEGPYAELAGAEVPVAAGSGAVSPRAQELFEASGGSAMLVQRGDVLEVELYAESYGRDTQFGSYSMVKTLVGLLILRAIAEGDLSRDQLITDILGPAVPDLTVAEVLSMTGGLAATGEAVKADRDEAYGLFGPLARLHVYGPDGVAGDLEIRADWAGGFHYQSANTALLGAMLERLYQTPLNDQLAEAIWQPAGAAPALWRRYPQGDGISAYCCLYARAVDWVLVGRHILNNGTPEAPLLPDELWREWLLPDLDPDVRRAGAYGDHIRHDVLDRDGEAVSGPFAYAMGHGGQVLYLVPGADAVVVRFGEGPQLLHSTLYELLRPLEG